MGRDTENRTDKGIEGGGRKNLVRNLSHSSSGRGQDGTTAFYIETLVLLAVFTVVTIVLVNAFVLARRVGIEAGVLTDAVHLAENAAELVAASDSGETLFGLLNEGGNAFLLEPKGIDTGSVYRAEYDAAGIPMAGGVFQVDVSWLPEESGLVRSVVEVYWENGEEPVYTLETAVYLRNAK